MLVMEMLPGPKLVDGLRTYVLARVLYRSMKAEKLKLAKTKYQDGKGYDDLAGDPRGEDDYGVNGTFRRGPRGHAQPHPSPHETIQSVIGKQAHPSSAEPDGSAGSGILYHRIPSARMNVRKRS